MKIRFEIMNLKWNWKNHGYLRITMTEKKLLLLPGDGVGPEIMAEAIKVIDLFNKLKLSNLSYEYADIGGIAVDNHGTPYPEETSMKAGKADCILLGAVGTKKHEKNENKLKPESGLLAFWGVFPWPPPLWLGLINKCDVSNSINNRNPKCK